ncbi:MAG: sigma-70 family RNA polymerase sigma factor [Clostridia bacterium]|nr:sigma-70 family RNA polymerase sigma factor [Clostridia bacterium]
MTAVRQEFALRLINARKEGRQAVTALAEQHLPLVATLVKRFPGCGREKEELYQQGCVGLMKAISRYDPDYGTAFSTYAAAMILGEMRMTSRCSAPVHIPRKDRELRSRLRQAERMLTSHLQREPTIQELASALRMDAAELMLLPDEVTVTSLDAADERCVRPLSELLPSEDAWMDRLLLKDIVSRLSREDQRIFLMRFHLGKTQAETARSLGVSQMQISRRESAIKASVRKAWMDE